MAQFSNSIISILKTLKKDSMADEPKISQAIIVDAIKLTLSKASPTEKKEIKSYFVTNRTDSLHHLVEKIIVRDRK
jgi:hypothetical protein